MEPRLVNELTEARAAAAAAATSGARSEPNKLPVRERIAQLCDPDSFVEYGPLAQEESSGEPMPADGLVIGTARIEGIPVVVGSYDTTVAGGTQSKVNQAKLDRLVFHAVERRMPFVCFVDGGGWRKSSAKAGTSMWLGGGTGRMGAFDGLCELSGLAPSVAIVSGEALDGNADLAMFAECVIATRGSSLGKNPRPMSVEYRATRGDVDILVETESDAIQQARRYIAYLLKDSPTVEPSATAATIDSILPDNRRRAYDMRRVIDALADEGSVLELRPQWGTSLITSLVRMGGRTVGIFANQPMSPILGAIDATAADKMARFIELCDAYGVPLLSLIDSPGFHIGPDAERDGIARHHVRTLSAIEHRDVPLFCVQLRKAYGLGPLVMRGSWGHLPPDLRLAWPTVETGGMSLEGAAYLVKRKEIQAAKTPEEALAIRDAYANTLRERESGVRAAQNFSFDDIVMPSETRERIIRALENAPRIRREKKKTYVDLV